MPVRWPFFGAKLPDEVFHTSVNILFIKLSLFPFFWVWILFFLELWLFLVPIRMVRPCSYMEIAERQCTLQSSSYTLHIPPSRLRWSPQHLYVVFGLPFRVCIKPQLKKLEKIRHKLWCCGVYSFIHLLTHVILHKFIQWAFSPCLCAGLLTGGKWKVRSTDTGKRV